MVLEVLAATIRQGDGTGVGGRQWTTVDLRIYSLKKIKQNYKDMIVYTENPKKSNQKK